MDSTVEPLRILAFAALTLSVRVLTWIALTISSTLFAVAVVYPARERTIAAALFAILIYLPSIFVEKRKTTAPAKPRRPEEQTYEQVERVA